MYHTTAIFSTKYSRGESIGNRGTEMSDTLQHQEMI